MNRLADPGLRLGFAEQAPRQVRDAVVGIVEDRRQRLPEAVAPLRQDDAELAQQPAQLIDQPGPLADHRLADAVQDEDRLLLDRLDGDEAHVRPRHGFADRLGVIAVVLAALPVRGDEARRHDARVVAELPDLAGEVMGAGARFHADQAGRHLREFGQQIGAADSSPQHRLAILSDTMHTEYILRQVDPDNGRFHDEFSFRDRDIIDPRFGGSVAPGVGGVHFIRWPHEARI